MTYSQEKTQLIKADLEMIEMTELSDKENMNIEMRQMEDMRIKWSI